MNDWMISLPPSYGVKRICKLRWCAMKERVLVNKDHCIFDQNLQSLSVSQYQWWLVWRRAPGALRHPLFTKRALNTLLHGPICMVPWPIVYIISSDYKHSNMKHTESLRAQRFCASNECYIKYHMEGRCTQTLYLKIFFVKWQWYTSVTFGT